MATTADHEETWECGVCFDDLPTATAKPCTITSGEEQVGLACAPCLRDQFLAAQGAESCYPVTWGSAVTLHPRSFPGVFDRSFVMAYETKEIEYAAPALMRLYCDCGVFAAPMVNAQAQSSWESMASSKLCKACKARWCLRCSQRCAGFAVPHECDPEKRLAERRFALGGLPRGRDWQYCPGEGCGRVIELAEACNHILCECGMGFCYLCVTQAEGTSDHWMRETSGCPRWGIPGSGREVYDEPGAHDDDDDDDEDEEDGGDEEDDEPWPLGEGEATIFDFSRWAWAGLISGGTHYGAQLRLIRGRGAEQLEPDIISVHAAMLEYRSISHSSINLEEWRALAEANEETSLTWLRMVALGNWGVHGAARLEHGGGMLDFSPPNVFNVSIAGDREAGARWAQEASAASVAFTRGIDHAFPGSAVFDVGPGGRDGESWRLREMEMFEGLPGLDFYRLAGHVLMVVPRLRFAMGDVEDEADDERQVMVHVVRGFQPIGEEPPVEAGEPDQAAQAPEPTNPGAQDPLIDIFQALLDAFGDASIQLSKKLGIWQLGHTVLVGETNQQAFDEDYGLLYFNDAPIPGSWSDDNDLVEPVQLGNTGRGWKRINELWLREQAALAYFLVGVSMYVDIATWYGAKFVLW